MLMKQ